MGDVIEFKTREVNVVLDVDPQLQIERAIVELWKRLGGFDLALDEYDYLVFFLAFSDLCFAELENEQMNVHEDGYMSLEPDVYKRLKGIIDAAKTNPPANDQ